MDKMKNTQPCTLEWVTLRHVYIVSQISPEGMSPTAYNRTLFGDAFYRILSLPIWLPHSLTCAFSQINYLLLNLCLRICSWENPNLSWGKGFHTQRGNQGNSNLKARIGNLVKSHPNNIKKRRPRGDLPRNAKPEGHWSRGQGVCQKACLLLHCHRLEGTFQMCTHHLFAFVLLSFLWWLGKTARRQGWAEGEKP